MSSIKSIVSDAKCHELHTVTKSASEKFLCYTRTESDGDCFIIGASNGCDVWRVDPIDLEELKALSELADLSIEKYLEKIRNAFLQGDIQASHIGTKVTLDIGQGTKALTHELYEAKAAQKRIETSCILFRLAERSSELETRLESTDKELASLKRQKPSGFAEGSGLLLDLDAKRSKQPKMQPKKPGMSAVNPASRKKKTAQGVQFD